MFNIFPEWLYNKIAGDYLKDYIYEVRIRVGKPIVICYKGCYEKITINNGLKKNFIIATKDLIEYIVSRATKNSLYAFNNEIKQGYITTDSGIRIGICGQVVYDKKEVSTIKNISSLNIRIAHQVVNCSDSVIDLIIQNRRVKNTLIVSPPGAGKTTMIRDIVTKLSNEKNIQNILVIDERYELAGVGEYAFNLGDSVDVISGAEKNYAFSNTIKTMSPTVMVTDEISNEKDIEAICQAIRSGVSVIATAHAENLIDVKHKKYLSKMLDNKTFERIVVLSKKRGVGTVELIVDENLKGLYLPYLAWRFY